MGEKLKSVGNLLALAQRWRSRYSVKSVLTRPGQCPASELANTGLGNLSWKTSECLGYLNFFILLPSECIFNGTMPRVFDEESTFCPSRVWNSHSKITINNQNSQPTTVTQLASVIWATPTCAPPRKSCFLDACCDTNGGSDASEPT